MCTVYHNHLAKFVPGSIVCSCRHTPLEKKNDTCISDTVILLFFLTTLLRLISNKMASAKIFSQ